jgi:hypothetical protein
MEEHRSLAACLLTPVLAFLVGATGCGLLALTDGSGDSETDARKLQIDGLTPSADRLSTTPTIRLHFTDYLDVDSFDNRAAVVLTSGGLSWPGTADYRMVERELVWRPSNELPAGVRVELLVNEEIRSVVGSTIEVTEPFRRWTVASDGASADVDRPDHVAWSDVEPIFDSRCNGCHGDPEWDLPPMTRDVLLNRRSEQVDRPLVRPFDAAGSYLMHKLLWDYPDRRYQPQPPPWSEKGTELPDEQLRRIEAWIDAGAPP